MIELKNLRDDLSVGGGHCARRYSAALQFGIGLWHDQIQASRFNQRKTLRAQLSGKQTKRLGWCNGHIAGEGDGAFNARVDHHIVARQGGQGFGHGIDFCIVEIQCDGFGRLLARSIGFFAGLGGLCLSLSMDRAAEHKQRQTNAHTGAQAS